LFAAESFLSDFGKKCGSISIWLSSILNSSRFGNAVSKESREDGSSVISSEASFKTSKSGNRFEKSKGI
jgi:hypothetical protein